MDCQLRPRKRQLRAQERKRPRRLKPTWQNQSSNPVKRPRIGASRGQNKEPKLEVRIPAIVTGDSGERDRVGVARIDCRLGLVFWVLTPLFQTQ
jgi:hypothetical protein